MTEYKKMRITPDMARAFLDNNYDGNRHINKRTVSTIANDMNNGLFVSDNGQTITITSDGRLVDGQHRMAALTESGKALDFLVCVIEPERISSVFSTIDVGKPRSLSQFVGGKDCAGTSALARVDYAFRMGTATLAMSLDGHINGTSVRASTPVLAKWHDDNREMLEQAYKQGKRVSLNTRCGNPTAIGSAIILLNYLGLDQRVDEFVNDLCSLTPTRQVSGAFIRKAAKVRAESLTRGSALRRELALCFLTAYDGWCDGGGMRGITRTDKTLAKYDNLLRLQREIDRSPIVPYAG